MEAHQQLYTANQDKLTTAIDGTSEIVTELRQFNNNRWRIHYPESTTSEVPQATPIPSHSLEDGDGGKEQSQHPGLQRSATYQVQPTLSSVPITPRKQPIRSETTRDMSVLKLELKVGPSAKTPSALVHSLEKSSIAQLLDGRFAQSLTQLENLKKRVSDKQSKVLVTGDLNAGKSTYVNALLRRKVMPTDQQPCTTVFCERMRLWSSVTARTLALRRNHFSRNGVVDIALIDAPGLNTDSIKTTNLFARQDEIDVVVFVVSAENHFTLSAKEFLWNASNDKAYVFIVVNKYDQIRNKERCRQRVLEQIRQLSPRTYEDAENLVHFVDSSAVMQGDEDNNELASLQPFSQMETALRDFVLHKRSVSKLQPAQTYLLKVLFDIGFLARTNMSVATKEMKEAREVLSVARPALQKIQSNAIKLETQLEGEEDGVVGGIVDGAKSRLGDAIERLASGQTAEAGVSLPEYPGLFGVWDYAREVRETLLNSVEMAVRNVEDLARDCTKEAVEKIRTMGEKHLPEMQRRATVSSTRGHVCQAQRPDDIRGLGLGAELVQVRISDISMPGTT
ncbi:hypothetical protein L7F22_001357 [Adiantum nelumboides]|nr:hypothetical protein [Adiantum nelumboides]